MTLLKQLFVVLLILFFTQTVKSQNYFLSEGQNGFHLNLTSIPNIQGLLGLGLEGGYTYNGRLTTTVGINGFGSTNGSGVTGYCTNLNFNYLILKQFDDNLPITFGPILNLEHSGIDGTQLDIVSYGAEIFHEFEMFDLFIRPGFAAMGNNLIRTTDREFKDPRFGMSYRTSLAFIANGYYTVINYTFTPGNTGLISYGAGTFF